MLSGHFKLRTKTKNDYKYKVVASKGDNHFTLIDTLANENSNICKEIIKLSK